MNNPLVQQLALSTFTPSTMPQTMLEGMFVQREQLLQSIVQDLAASVDGTKQYLMLVGARGMGKTHFVSLVYHRLKQKVELQDKLLIAWLREEEYGVNSWLYLIIEILRSLSQEGIETEEQIAKLAGLPITEAEYLANRVLMEVIGDKTLLIITENIDQLLYSLGEKEQWKFRAFLQETNCCSILATTPKISVDTSKKDKPFFGFFTPIHLQVFTHDDAVAMLIKIANLSGNISLAKFLATVEGKSRVRALHHLAGGNPRVYALFAQLITEDTLEALLPAVLEMLDKLTPYYQSRVESLGQSDDQQKIVMYLARQDRAVTVKEITAQCFISADKTTSNALKKLRDKGYVISTQRGREVFYEISEVLMRLCLEMKNDRDGDLKLCVDFLRIWYRPKERQEQLERLEGDGEIEKAKYFRMSLAEIKSDPILLACKRDLQKSLDGGDTDTALQVWQELVAENKVSVAENQLVAELINRGESANAITAIEALLEGETAEQFYLKGILLDESEQFEEALENFERVVKLKPDHYEAWFKSGIILGNLGRYEEELEHYTQAIQIKPDFHEAWDKRGVALVDLDRYEEAIDSYDRAIEINPNNDNTWFGRGNALNSLGKYQEAINSHDHAILINPDKYKVWYNRGNTLNNLGKYEEEINSYDHAIQIKPDYDKAWYNRGNALFRLGRYEEAIESFDYAIQIKSDKHEAWYNRGNSLFNVGRYAEAIDSFENAIHIKPDTSEAWYGRGSALFNLVRYEEAIQSFDYAIQIKPNYYEAWNGLGCILSNLRKYEEAIESFEHAILIKPDYYEAWNNRIIALGNLARYWHNQGLTSFNQGKYSDALISWQQSFNIIQKENLRDSTSTIQVLLVLLDNQLLPKFQQPSIRNILPQLLTIYANYQVLPELAVALTRNLKAIQSPTISDYTATEWLKMWQELAKPHPELALALRMLVAGIKYKQNPQDDRVFLSLPQEMRPLLREALGLE
jgi:tetratricopeptide (TPR) repeat protein